MGTPNAEWMREYRKKNADKIKAQQKATDERRKTDPATREKYLARRRAEYLRKNPGAETAEERSARRKAMRSETALATIGTERICCDCGVKKPLDEYSNHGPRGKRAYCKECGQIRRSESRKAANKAWAEKNKDKVKRQQKAWVSRQKTVVVQKHVTPKVYKRNSLRDDGWRTVFQFGDSNEIVKVYMKGVIIRIMRMPATGQYSTGKTTYSIAFDDSGKRFATLAHAEREAKKWA